MAEEIIESTPIPPHFKHGGRREGAGKPQGSISRIHPKWLLDQLDITLGKPYVQQLSENYRDALIAGDTQLISAYDRLFVSRLIAERHDITSDGQQMKEIITITMDPNEYKSTGQTD